MLFPGVTIVALAALAALSLAASRRPAGRRSATPDGRWLVGTYAAILAAGALARGRARRAGAVRAARRLRARLRRPAGAGAVHRDHRARAERARLRRRGVAVRPAAAARRAWRRPWSSWAGRSSSKATAARSTWCRSAPTSVLAHAERWLREEPVRGRARAADRRCPVPRAVHARVPVQHAAAPPPDRQRLLRATGTGCRTSWAGPARRCGTARASAARCSGLRSIGVKYVLVHRAGVPGLAGAGWPDPSALVDVIEDSAGHHRARAATSTTSSRGRWPPRRLGPRWTKARSCGCRPRRSRPRRRRCRNGSNTRFDGRLDDEMAHRAAASRRRVDPPLLRAGDGRGQAGRPHSGRGRRGLPARTGD